ncbi:MAG: GntR family transcriptional regulator [Chitinivibrionales bacterium]|nr:GntR family transcriptional regulator [Chitinivibrionales bacterium]
MRRAGRIARAYVEELVREHARVGRDRLPTVAAMAAACAVSKSAVERALHALAAEGLVRVVPRGGIFVGDASVKPGTNVRRVGHSVEGLATVGHIPRWRTITDELATQITMGVYADGAPLPSVKELCARYGASHKTVRRALHNLCTNGRLNRIGRRYRVHQLPRLRSTASVVFIARRSYIENRRRDRSRAGRVLRYLERELHRVNVACLLVPYEDFVASEGQLLRRHPRHSSRSILGYLVQLSTVPHVPLERFLQLLNETGLPVAMLDETGYRTRQIDVRRYHRLRLFGVATGVRAGWDVGAFLAALGHSHAAFISPAGRSGWVLNRLAGLRAILGDERVQACQTGRYWFDLALDGRLVTDPREQLMREEARSKLLSLGVSFPEDYLLPSADLFPVFEPLLRHLLLPALEEAICLKEATAWVAGNDVVALACLAWLREKGIRIPDELSLVSFDDTYEAFSEEITSYDFGVPAVARAMLEYCVRGESTSPRPTTTPVEIPGTIIARRSVAPRGGARSGVFYGFERISW